MGNRGRLFLTVDCQLINVNSGIGKTSFCNHHRTNCCRQESLIDTFFLSLGRKIWWETVYLYNLNYFPPDCLLAAKGGSSYYTVQKLDNTLTWESKLTSLITGRLIRCLQMWYHRKNVSLMSYSTWAYITWIELKGNIRCDN